jgi:thiol:disulfide interchange protein
MKSTKMVLGIAVIALGFTSCKDEKAVEAEKTVDSYVMYVDSLGNVASEDAKENWEGIETTYQLRSEEAQAALANMKDNTAAQERLAAATAKYEAMKAKYEAEVQENAKVAVAANPKQQLRNALFGEGKIGEDMNFSWVNKDNILGIYQNFVNTVDNNKDAYSREDWDEVKLMYEALDSRKNTVEKEGLSGDDNRKIAGLKLKFAPMYTLNRMGAKNGEMQRAKE